MLCLVSKWRTHFKRQKLNCLFWYHAVLLSSVKHSQMIKILFWKGLKSNVSAFKTLTAINIFSIFWINFILFLYNFLTFTDDKQIIMAFLLNFVLCLGVYRFYLSIKKSVGLSIFDLTFYFNRKSYEKYHLTCTAKITLFQAHYFKIAKT